MIENYDFILKQVEEIELIKGCIRIKDNQISYLQRKIVNLEYKNKELIDMLNFLHQKVSELTRI